MKQDRDHSVYFCSWSGNDFLFFIVIFYFIFFIFVFSLEFLGCSWFLPSLFLFLSGEEWCYSSIFSLDPFLPSQSGHWRYQWGIENKQNFWEKKKKKIPLKYSRSQAADKLVSEKRDAFSPGSVYVPLNFSKCCKRCGSVLGCCASWCCLTAPHTALFPSLPIRDKDKFSQSVYALFRSFA